MSQITTRGSDKDKDSHIAGAITHTKIILGLCIYTVIEVGIGAYMLIDFPNGSKFLN